MSTNDVSVRVLTPQAQTFDTDSTSFLTEGFVPITKCHGKQPITRKTYI